MICDIIAKQREFFLKGETLSIDFRVNKLNLLKNAVVKYEEEILKSLSEDLGKSSFEGYMTEIGMLFNEITHLVKNLKKWGSPKKIRTPISQFPAKSYIYRDPYGVVLVMSPWNYPFLLTLNPVAGAIAGGNTVVVKPSNYSPNVSLILKKILGEVFPEEYIAVILGGRNENEELLNQQFDLIFFTGGATVGRLVMEKASKHLTPVVLELGGKSPCIVDENADLDLVAKRIVFGKILNAGQTCVAPDYVCVHVNAMNKLVEMLIHYIKKFLGGAALADDFPKIINEKHYKRLMELISGETVLYGGIGDGKKIIPTIISNVDFQSKIMQEEIFGPILPIISFDNLDKLLDTLKKMPSPLALYLFTNSSKTEKKVMELRFGGGCINDTIVHLATNLPFGGVGNSGMGNYHGIYTFRTFTREKGVLKRGKLDLNMRYRPYTKKKEKLIKKFLK